MNMDDIVNRRRTRSRTHRDVSKRVSFDETSIKGRRIDEFIQSTSLQNVKCISEDNFELSSSNDLDYGLEKHDVAKTSKNVIFTHEPPKFMEDEFVFLTERGIPEGQEDTKLYSSTSTLSDFSKDLTKDSRRISDRSYGASIAQFNRTKASLVKKFLKSIPIRNIRHKDQFPLNKSCITTLHVKNINFSDLPDHSTLIKSLSDDVKRHHEEKNCAFLRLKQSFLTLVIHRAEKIYKVFKVLSVDSRPILAVITSDSLCFLSYGESTDTFEFEYSTGFETLLAAVVGPFSEIVVILDSNNDRFYFNTGISDRVGFDLISHLEVAIRRWCLNSKRELNFNVAKIHDLNCMNVFHDTILDNNFSKNEQLIAQYSVWLQKNYVDTELPLGLQKESYLMTKIAAESSWCPSYVCLTDGVLYLFEKNSQRTPKFVIPLRSNVYKGCRIHNNLQRPHSFEILLEGNTVFNFGAADEAEMMEWIQLLYASALQISRCNVSDSKQKLSTVNCFVTLSNAQILLHRFPNQIIGRALLNDVSTFTVSSWSKSYYCLLELECQEASEIGGDWILYFVSRDSYESFCSKFAEICDHSTTKYQVEGNRYFMRKSDHISAQIRSLWDPFFATRTTLRNE